MKFKFLPVVLVLAFASSAVDAQQPALFEYDRNAKAEYREESVTEQKKIIVREILYASSKGGMVTATLVEPQRKKATQLAAVIYLHGAGGNRKQFLPEASELVKSGKFFALLIDLPSARPAPWKKSEYDYLKADYDMRVQTIIDVRCAIDLLEKMPQMDASRIALVGYSYGAATGGILAGIEKRLSAFVLMASGGSQVDFWHDEKNPDAINLKKMLKEERFNRFVETLRPVEQIDYIKSSTAPIFFQFAEKDEFSSKDSMLKFYEAANKPKTVKWYDAGHQLNVQATVDRFRWLKNQLKETKNSSFNQKNF